MEPITIKITILEPLQKVWDYFYHPKHIMKWNFATPNWHCPKASIDFRVGGHFNYRMEYRDKSYGYDFAGTIEEIREKEYVRTKLTDGRTVEVFFNELDPEMTEIVQIFEPEHKYSREMQRMAWYAILDRFHKHVENAK